MTGRKSAEKHDDLYVAGRIYSLIKSNDFKLENAEGKIIKSEVVLKFPDKMTGATETVIRTCARRSDWCTDKKEITFS